MPARISWKSLGLAAVFVFTLLFPAIHEVEHVQTERASAVCIHQKSTQKNELTHLHASLKACVGCAFHYSPLQLAEQLRYASPELTCMPDYAFNYTTLLSRFSSQNFLLRGPPSC